MRRSRTAAATAAMILLACSGAASGDEAGQGAALAARHTDEFNGYSLCPPAGTERLWRASRRQLARWNRRDEKTQAVRWWLEVLRTRQEPSELPLAKYAEAVAKELAKADFQVESTEVGTVAGRPAMHFRGQSKGKLTLWRRQTWVQIEPSQHLVLSIQGPVTDKQEMDAVLTAVAGSLKLFDPAAALAKRRESLARGAAALAALDEAALKGLAARKSYYFSLQMKGRTVGFVKVTESVSSRWKARGLWVVRLGALQLPGQPRRLTREELFATPDRSFERWRRTVTEGEGPAASTNVREAVKQKNVVMLQSKQSGQARPVRQRKIPEAILPAYLPQAFDVVVGRIVRRAKDGTYGFAMHNAGANDFDLRTIQVIGEEQIDLSGRKVKAIHLRDQMALNAPPADVWVDADGALLRMRSAEGLIMERSGKAAVAARFGAELRKLEKGGS